MHPVARRVALTLAAVVAVIAAAVFVSIGFKVTTGADCARCHVKGAFKTASAKQPHADVACNSCHGGSSIDARVRFVGAQVFGMYLHGQVDPTVANVDSAKCEACHRKDISHKTTSQGLTIQHSTCAKGRECTDCHATVAHGSAISWRRTVNMTMCYDCHGANGVEAECDSCHAARLPSERIKSGWFAVTHGPNYKRTHGMGDTKTCSQCHASKDCATCHGGGVPHSTTFIVDHPQYAKSSSAKCSSCHKTSFCTDCHRYPMPHPKGFATSHSTIVKRDGRAACNRCHETSDCENCHLNHIHPTSADELRGLGVKPSGGGN